MTVKERMELVRQQIIYEATQEGAATDRVKGLRKGTRKALLHKEWMAVSKPKTMGMRISLERMMRGGFSEEELRTEAMKGLEGGAAFVLMADSRRRVAAIRSYPGKFQPKGNS